MAINSEGGEMKTNCPSCKLIIPITEKLYDHICKNGTTRVTCKICGTKSDVALTMDGKVRIWQR